MRNIALRFERDWGRRCEVPPPTNVDLDHIDVRQDPGNEEKEEKPHGALEKALDSQRETVGDQQGQAHEDIAGQYSQGPGHYKEKSSAQQLPVLHAHELEIG